MQNCLWPGINHSFLSACHEISFASKDAVPAVGFKCEDGWDVSKTIKNTF